MNGEKIIGVDTFQFKNIKFDYLGKGGKQKIPTSYEINIEGVSFDPNDEMNVI